MAFPGLTELNIDLSGLLLNYAFTGEIMKKYLVILGLLASFAAFADDGSSSGADSDNGNAVQQNDNAQDSTPAAPDSQQSGGTDSSGAPSMDNPDSNSGNSGDQPDSNN
jgi:hypothetical protein